MGIHFHAPQPVYFVTCRSKAQCKTSAIGSKIQNVQGVIFGQQGEVTGVHVACQTSTGTVLITTLMIDEKLHSFMLIHHKSLLAEEETVGEERCWVVKLQQFP